MNRLHRLATRLYPRAWRDRYGDELAALLEDAQPGFAGALDLIKGALFMHLEQPRSPLLILAIATLLGLVTAGIFGLTVEKKYQSSARIQIVRKNTNLENSGLLNLPDVFSRANLTRIVNDQRVYRDEQRRMPMQDVIQKMSDNIRITPVIPGDPPDFSAPPTFDLSFQYLDPVEAQQVVTALTNQVISTNAAQNPEQDGQDLVVLEQPTLPHAPIQPAWLRIFTVGLGGGVLLGALVILLRRFFRRPAPPQRTRRPPNGPGNSREFGDDFL